MIRYLLDEHVPHAICRGLQLRGVDVMTAAEAGLLSRPDDVVNLFALSENRVVFTQDHDFLRLHSMGVAHAGIVYSKQQRRTIGEIVRALKLLCDCLDESDMCGRMEFI